MCGIVCWIRANNETQSDAQTLKEMTQALSHRGPDGEGFYTDGSVGLGHTRLAIIDIEHGQQPMVRDSIAVTFNGEIYNFSSLKAILMEEGYHFETNCDTEVLIHGWLHWGENLVDHLRGMFAFIIWDPNQRCVFIARDRLGVKPLYWALTDDGDFLAASELKALKKHPSLDRTLCDKAIEDFFSLGYVTEPNSILKSVKKVSPGSSIKLDLDNLTDVHQKAYWNLTEHLGSEKADPEALAKEFSEHLDESVKLRMIADVKIGAFLSGGVDSTVIVSTMESMSKEPVRTCSIGFDLSAYDESFFAEKVAKHYGCEHVTTNVSVNDLSLVDKIVDIYDEPFADNSAIPTYILSQVTSKQVKVALSGDGADELLFGYRNHQLFRLEEVIRNIFPSSIRKPLFGMLAKCYPQSNRIPRVFRARTTLESLVKDRIDSYHNAISITSQDTLKAVYSEQFRQALNGYSSLSLFKRLAAEVKHLEPLKQVQYIDFKTYLPGDILTKVDRASMAASLEVRVPFLDHKLVEWGLKIKPIVNLSIRSVKKLIVKTYSKSIPDYILKRNKMGFTSPLDEWFRQIPLESLQTRIMSPELLDTHYFDENGIHTILSEHHNRIKNHGLTIWSLVIFESFLRKLKKN